MTQRNRSDPTLGNPSFDIMIVGGGVMGLSVAKKMPILLSRKDLRQLLMMTEVIEAVEKGFREYKTGSSVVPVRMPVRIEKTGGVFLFMPAYLERENSFGTKKFL